MAENSTPKATDGATAADKPIATAKAAAAKASDVAKSTTAKTSDAAKAATAKSTEATKTAATKATDGAKSAAAKARSAATAAAPTSAKDAAEKAKGAAYTVVGLGVMGINKAQAGARQLVVTVKSKDLSQHVTSIKSHAGTVAKATTNSVAKADKHVEATITKVEDRIQPYEQKLPTQARDLVKKAHDTGRETRAKVRAKVFSA